MTAVNNFNDVSVKVLGLADTLRGAPDAGTADRDTGAARFVRRTRAAMGRSLQRAPIAGSISAATRWGRGPRRRSMSAAVPPIWNARSIS